MYTVSKGPSKIVAKTRRGITQKLDSLESQRELIYGKKPNTGIKDHYPQEEMSSPKPVFQPMNGKRSTKSRLPIPEVISPQHEKMVDFVHAEWSRLCMQYDDTIRNGATDAQAMCCVKYYEETEPNPELDNFEPFDLESWWGKRFYNNLTQST